MFGQQHPDGWHDGVVASRVMDTNGPLAIALAGAFDHTVWSYVTKLINADFPVILPNGKKVSLPRGSKIFIEVPDFASIATVNLKDFCPAAQSSDREKLRKLVRNGTITGTDKVPRPGDAGCGSMRNGWWWHEGDPDLAIARATLS